MLKITDEVRYYLRQVQRAAEGRERARKAAAVRDEHRKMDADRFRTLAARAARILDTGRDTKFEHESAVRSGIRSALCFEKWKWRDADMCAAAIIERALSALGAIRPSWDDAQGVGDLPRNIENYYCIHCRSKLDADCDSRTKYCSDECKQAASSARFRAANRKRSQAEYSAQLAAARITKKQDSVRDCTTCGKPFFGTRAHVEFCSSACFQITRRRHADQECGHCGLTYTPISRGKDRPPGVFCSKACQEAQRAARKAAATATCPTCKTVFGKSKPSGRQKYCSAPCNPYSGISSQPSFQCSEVI